MTTPPLDPTRARLASGYGWRRNGSDLHTGIDLAARRGEPVRAVRAGVVLVSAPSGALNKYGNVIVLQHASGEATLYAHLDTRAVVRGNNVIEGQQIGTVGTTGGTREEPSKQVGAPHLHFELLTRWPPRGIDRDRLDPSRLWPPAIASTRELRPWPPATPPAAQQSRPGTGGGVIVAAILLWEATRR